MHNVLFGLKRSFHKSTWFGRGILAPYALTPSRFDVLYLLRESRARYCWQSDIRKILGVTAATTSIMVRALERLGLVRRRVSELDERQREVSLTARGRALIARATKVLRGKELVDYFVKRLVSPSWWDQDRSFADVDAFENSIRFLRTNLRDRAKLTYGSHPDH